MRLVDHVISASKVVSDSAAKLTNCVASIDNFAAPFGVAITSAMVIAPCFSSPRHKTSSENCSHCMTPLL